MLAVLSPLLIKERTTSREGVSVVVAVLGVVLVANAGMNFKQFGFADLSALLAALFIALYSLVGRYLRTSGLATACYTSYVYTVSAGVILVLAMTLGESPFRLYDAQNLLAILGLAVVPTAVGHSLYNYAFRID